MVPARVKFARFRSVQKCTLFVFRPQFESLPSKIFLSENIFIGKIRFPFHWFHFKNLSTNRLAVTGWKLKADLTKKCFFLFFNLSEIKRLFSLCNKEIFNFWGKFFFQVSEYHIDIQRGGLWSPASNASVCNFWLGPAKKLILTAFFIICSWGKDTGAQRELNIKSEKSRIFQKKFKKKNFKKNFEKKFFSKNFFYFEKHSQIVSA